jgi:hypothetical protein
LDRSRTDPGGRILQSIEDVSDRIRLDFLASNLMEVEILDYSEYDPLTASLTFLYPLLEKSTPEANGYAPFGWFYTESAPIESYMTANRFLLTAIYDVNVNVAQYSDVFWYVTLGIFVINNYTGGMNWLAISTF